MNYEVKEEYKRSLYQIETFINLGRYEKAKLFSSNLIAKYPDCYNAYYAMAICEVNIGSVDNAIELCIKALELGKSQKSVSSWLMICYNKKNDFVNFDKQYHSIRKLDPYCNDENALYGYSLCRRGRRKEGIEIIKLAHAYDPSNPQILEYLLYATGRNSYKEETDKLLELYMNTNASHQKKIAFAGRCETRVGKWDEAVTRFESVLSLDPSNKEALRYLRLIEKCRMISSFIGILLCIAVLCFIDDFLIGYDISLPVKVFMLICALIVMIIIFIKSLVKVKKLGG